MMHQLVKLFFIHAILIAAHLGAAQASQQLVRTQAEQKEIDVTFISDMVGLQLKLAQEAFAQGADINAKTQAGGTLLILWLKGVYLADYRWLLDQGPSPFVVEVSKNKNAYDYGYLNPRRFIELLEHPQHKKIVLAELGKVFAESTPIHMKDLIAIIQDYALCGPTTENLNAAVFSLLKSCDDGAANRISYFLEYGADCNGRDENERTPLMCAIFTIKTLNNITVWQLYDIDKYIEILLHAGADITLQDNNNCSVQDYIQDIEFSKIYKAAIMRRLIKHAEQFAMQADQK